MGRMMGAALAALALGGCAAAPVPEVARGRALFAQYCSACHGADARGGGPAAVELPAPPADLTMLRSANGGVWPAERVMAQVYGYPGRFHSAAMPEFGPLLEGRRRIWTAPDKRQVPTPENLLALNAYLESLQEG